MAWIVQQQLATAFVVAAAPLGQTAVGTAVMLVAGGWGLPKAEAETVVAAGLRHIAAAVSAVAAERRRSFSLVK